MLRTPIASLAVVLGVGALADAQVPTPNTANRGFLPQTSGTRAPGLSAVPAQLELTPTPETRNGSTPVATPSATEPTSRTYESGAVLPEPTTPDPNSQPSIVLPTTPIEPYLLQRQNGPFMVLAKTFRGPEAARYAQALAMELRSQHRLPAYVWHLRLQPGHSNIRDVPPTAPDYVRSGETVVGAERVRSYDEAAVLVGDCKTIDESEDLLHQVRKIHSVVVDGTPSLWSWKWRKGLSRAMLTTNPLRASQELFPAKDADGHPNPHQHPPGIMLSQNGQPVDPYVLTAGFQNTPRVDPLILQMNDPKANQRSLYNCPGPYALQVAEFLGRSTTDENDPRFASEDLLRQSPLRGAAEEAERLAANIAKCRSVPAGMKPYVFHDRHASRVLLGPIANPNDPNLAAIVQNINNSLSVELIAKKHTMLPLAPAGYLTPVPSR